MKNSYIPQVVGTGLIAVSLIIVPLNVSAQAQSTNGTNSTTSTQNRDANATGPITANTEADHNNWGWLGLLGLTGLAGLARKQRPATTQYVSNDPNVGAGSSNDFR